MLQLIARQTVGNPTVPQGRLADPDLLLRILESAETTRDETQKHGLSKLFSQVLHDLRMGGAWKRTGSRRLPRTEEKLQQYLARHRFNDVTVLDLGASDGITTLELLQALRDAGYTRVTACATDLNLWLFRFWRGPVVEYRAGNGEPIMVRLGPLGLRLSRHRREVEGSNLLSRWYLRSKGFRDTMRLGKRIALVNPLVRSEPDITISELNCLERNDRFVAKFTAARASNVLNLGYFDPDQIVSAVGNLHAYLREDGCLVVSRNVDTDAAEVENGSVWVRRADRFERVDDFGSGSEIKEIVDNWRAK